MCIWHSMLSFIRQFAKISYKKFRLCHRLDTTSTIRPFLKQISPIFSRTNHGDDAGSDCRSLAQDWSAPSQLPKSRGKHSKTRNSEETRRFVKLFKNLTKICQKMGKVIIGFALKNGHFSGYVHQYLCVVPQERKFCNALISVILFESARWVTDFSALKAARAFEAIEKYAANLINQPWRKEFKEIKVSNL